MLRHATLAAIAGFGLPLGAASASVIQFDVNAVRAEATSPMTAGFTGTITVSKTGESVLEDILDEDSATLSPTGSLTAFTATFAVVAGEVQGGVLDLLIDDGSRYTAALAPGGFVVGPFGPAYMIGGLTSSGSFSNLVGGTHFAGVNVGQFAGNNALTGSFIMYFEPNGAGVDASAAIDIFVIPAPGTAGLLAAAGLMASRRRR